MIHRYKKYVYQIEVDSPIGTKRMGRWYATKKQANGRKSFVRAAWHGYPVRVVKVPMQFPVRIP